MIQAFHSIKTSPLTGDGLLPESFGLRSGERLIEFHVEAATTYMRNPTRDMLRRWRTASWQLYRYRELLLFLNRKQTREARLAHMAMFRQIMDLLNEDESSNPYPALEFL